MPPRGLRRSTGGCGRRREHVRDEVRKGRERARGDAVREALASLRPGDVIFVPAGPAPGARRGAVQPREGRPTVLAQDRKFFRLSARDFEEPPAVLTQVPLPRSGSVRSARYRRDLAARLVALDVRPPAGPGAAGRRAGRARGREVSSAWPRHTRATPAPTGPSHERWAIRASQVEQQIRGVDRRIRTRTETLARQFERVLGGARGARVRPGVRDRSRRGGRSRGSTARATSWWPRRSPRACSTGLSPAEVAAVVSTIVYESRERVPADTARCRRRRRPSGTGGSGGIWRRVREAEDRHQVELCRELEDGFATPIHRWAEGEPLEDVLRETDMAPGDFVRNCKQLLDLLRQIEEVAPRASRPCRPARPGGGQPRGRRLHGGLSGARPAAPDRMRAMSSPYGELTVIVNPHAGKRHVGEEIPELERTLRARGLPYRLLRTRGPGGRRRRFAREALEGGARFVVAVGGDGTVHEVVNGMFDDEGKPVVRGRGPRRRGGRERLRLRPDLRPARRRDPRLPPPRAATTRTRSTSARSRTRRSEGERASRYFVNVAEAGLGAAVTARAERMSPRLGPVEVLLRRSGSRCPRFKLANVRVQADRKTYEGPAYLVVVGNAQYYGGGMKVSPRSYPGDGGARRARVQGTEVRLVHDDPEGLPGRAHPARPRRGVPRQARAHDRGRPAAADRGGRRGARDHARHVRDPRAADPDEAVSADRYAERRRARPRGGRGGRARRAARHAGADLVYLTGYAPPPLERLTLLILAAGRAPVLVVPALERPAAESARPASRASSSVDWRDGGGPVRGGRADPRAAGRYAVTDQTWASHLLALRAGGAPGASFEAAGEALPLLRAVKDADEIARLRAAGRGADAAFADDRRRRRSPAARARRRRGSRPPPARARPRARRLHDRRFGAERRLAAPRAPASAGSSSRGRRRAGLRRAGGAATARTSPAPSSSASPSAEPLEVYDDRPARSAGGVRGGAPGRRGAGRRPRGALGDRGGGLRRAVRPPDRPRHRPRGPRAARTSSRATRRRSSPG